MLKEITVTVITPTWKRHRELLWCIEQVKRQDFSKPYEHIVVSDGPDEEVRTMCKYYNITYQSIERKTGKGTSRGHAARDAGISAASGQYLVLWDDDNIYHTNALSSLYEASKDFDIGVRDILFRLRPPDSPLTFAREAGSNQIYCTLPKNWSGHFQLRNIDTMNVMVKTTTARLTHWTESSDYEGDYYWLNSLQEKGSQINYLPGCIGIKVM